DVLEVIVAWTHVPRVSEGGRLRPGRVAEHAEPEDPLAREVPDGRPQWPTVRGRLDREVLSRHATDHITEGRVVVRPRRIRRVDRCLGHAATVSFGRARCSGRYGPRTAFKTVARASARQRPNPLRTFIGDT